MGNCVFQNDQNDKQANLQIQEILSKHQFQREYAIGRGGFGKVWKVSSKKFKNQSYALKEISKARVIAKKSLYSVLQEQLYLQ